MTLAEFTVQEDNHFVAMEYYKLILNRTFLILFYKDQIIGVQANGVISAQVSPHSLESLATYAATKHMMVMGDLSNPHSYLKNKYLMNMANLDLLEDEFLKRNGNFRINKNDIKSVHYDPSKKWGMGQYPHDGKVYLETSTGKREFIILGDQSGAQIANKIMAF